MIHYKLTDRFIWACNCPNPMMPDRHPSHFWHKHGLKTRYPVLWNNILNGMRDKAERGINV